jgi:hypothetical protein
MPHAGQHVPLPTVGGVVLGKQIPGVDGAPSGPSQPWIRPSHGVWPPQGSHITGIKQTGVGYSSPAWKSASIEHLLIPGAPAPIPLQSASLPQAFPVVPSKEVPPLLLVLAPLLLPPVLLALLVLPLVLVLPLLPPPPVLVPPLDPVLPLLDPALLLLPALPELPPEPLVLPPSGALQLVELHA